MEVIASAVVFRNTSPTSLICWHMEVCNQVMLMHNNILEDRIQKIIKRRLCDESSSVRLKRISGWDVQHAVSS